MLLVMETVYSGLFTCISNIHYSTALNNIRISNLEYVLIFNCRAIGDQLENNPNKHFEYRASIVNYMEKNRDMFEPFLDAEDDGTFEEYIRSMRDNGMERKNWRDL